MDKQMKLDMGGTWQPRKRVVLQETQQPRRRVVLVSERRKLDESMLSPWVDVATTLPPCAGDWEVHDRARNLKLGRCRYDGKGAWSVPGWPFPKVFGAKVFWRGLSSDPKLQPEEIDWEAPF